ncbi:copper-binding protein [Pseudomonas chlororaphis]|uniref:Heavy metal efflux system protein n=1 Tax=Pseudomonas chlororaphis TaxID=587753 RepID=A0AAX3G8B0_9PSED|nr:copper-binding protein [Pseudomonas chlororaphis]WDG75450.1 copper-binding protein [Pseudomonas chlororaphis]WDH26914.1 copper-binding protein [Pseudomonas chlororaphis]WDH73970.1 copper-binding protein [Pseudomonas chlororaphis]VEF77930.1 heavy metal efflux system protein [Pseudomonas chlororaphis]
MKLIQIAFASVLAALSLAAHAQEMPGMKMDDMNGMPMKQQAQQAQQATAEGRIKAIDTAKQRVTIAHGAVPAVQWPPMTMAFAATAEQLAGLAVGDQVTFAFRLEGGAATILSIKK